MMPAKGALKPAICLTLLLAVAGVFDGVNGLLMAVPFFLLLGLLIAGMYPGEDLLEAVVKAVDSPPRASRAFSFRILEAAPRVSRLAPLGATGSRGPPHFD